MNWSPLMKEHKENLKKMSKKELINQVLIGIEKLSQQEISLDRRMEYKKQQEHSLRSAEYALEYKEKVIEKYKKLLEISIEDL